MATAAGRIAVIGLSTAACVGGALVYGTQIHTVSAEEHKKPASTAAAVQKSAPQAAPKQSAQDAPSAAAPPSVPTTTAPLRTAENYTALSGLNHRDLFKNHSIPEGYALELVQIVHRHGARTSARARFNNTHPCSWACGPHLAVHEVLPLEGRGLGDGASSFRTLHMPHRQAIKGTCFAGQLTPQGWKQLNELGRSLRATYVDRLGFLPTNGDDGHGNVANLVYVRSTSIRRAIESAQGLISGLFPPEKNNKTVDVNILQEHVENMYPGAVRCDRMKQLKQAFRETQESLAVAEAYAPIRDKISKALNIPAADLPSMHGLFDEFVCRDAHDVKLPEGITSEIVSELERLSNKHWFDMYRAHGELVRLGIGRFIGEMMHDMDASLRGEKRARFHVYSGHDTTVAPLLVGLGLLDHHWPAFASSITYEVMKSKSDGSRAVRVLYNGKPAALPACKDAAVTPDGTLCPYGRFVDIVSELVPKDFVGECAARSADPKPAA
eukprot:Opistho-2@28394